MDSKLIYLPVAELFPHPDNPRKDLGDLTELADSIKANGVMQNLTVVEREEGGYTVIIGHRRTAAAKAAGLAELPCVIVNMTPQEQVATMLLENMQRSDLNAYEQAQGFQLMMDFGETVDTIAQKTGFSKTTVNRRLELAKLDQTKLKEVSVERQITLGELEKLSQIGDIDERNALLDDIGTSNFNMKFNARLRKQQINAALPFVKRAIKELGATEVKQSQTYGAEYESISDILLANWKAGTKLVPDRYKDVKLYYLLDEDYGQLRIYEKKKKAPPVKRPQAEIDREKYIEDVRRQLDELSDMAAELRLEFVKGLKMTSANKDKMISGFIGAYAFSYIYWSNSPDKNLLCERMGLEWDYGRADECRDKFLTAIKDDPAPHVPLMIYQSFEVKSGNTHFYTEFKRDFPRWQKNLRLDAEYDWLCSLGYEMSDDERMMRDGTHPLFVDKDKVEVE